MFYWQGILPSPPNCDLNVMTAKPIRQRINFSEVAIGQRFFDPISVEYFVKQSDTLAAMVTGLGDGSVPDEFDADDVVGVDE
jgi:hypothetical protein